MSARPKLAKDANDALRLNGADALRATVLAAPVAAVVEPRAEPNSDEKPFEWALQDAATTWTDDPERLRSLSDPPIADCLLREREVVQVVGAAKTSKTWFSLAFALAVARGAPFIGRKTYSRKTLYLDYELKEGTFAKRLSMLSPERPRNFVYQCLRGAERLPTMAEIGELVRREGFGLVVVDSLYRTGWLSEENNNDSTARELARLQRFTRDNACSLVCVDHTAKGGGAERSAVDASRGASAKGGFFDAILVLRATAEGSDPGANYVTLDSVLRDWPAEKEMPLLAFRWTATTATIDAEGAVPRSAIEAASTKILEALAQSGTVTGKAAIMEATGLSEKTVRDRLQELVARGRVEESTDPTHRQRLLYNLVEPPQTA